MYAKIIVAVDIGALEKGERILRRAADLLDRGGEIIVLSVVEDVPSYILIDLPPDFVAGAVKDANEKLTAMCRRLAVPAVVEVRTGQAATGILASAEERKADLIIVASHVPDFSNYFLGATADRVVRHAKCSVLIERR